MTGMLHGLADGRGEFAVEAGAGAVGVHGGEQDFAGAAVLGFAGPLDDAAAGGLAAALDEDLRVAHGIGGLGSRRASMATTTACAPKLRADLADERRDRARAAELTLTLSAPASKTAAASSALRMPPPTVNGTKSSRAVRRTVSSSVAGLRGSR